MTLKEIFAGASLLALFMSGCGRAPVAGPADQSASPARTNSPTPVAASPSPTQAASGCLSTARPVPRSGAVFAYVSAQQDAMLFGGADAAGNVLGDTWTWKTGCWTQQTPAQSPGPRFDAAATYDPTRGMVLLYGGDGHGEHLSDTWSWDGSTWTQLASAGPSGPYLFAGPVAGFDPVSRRPLLYGLANGLSSQTWSWNGSSWQQLAPSKAPEGRESPSLALDPNRGQLMLFGGRVPNHGDLNETWFWDGVNWSLASLPTSPPGRFQAAMASWTAHRLVVLWGGAGAPGLDDAWVWNGTNWTKIASPGIRVAQSAIDTGSQVIFFGGAGPAGPHNDLLAYDGTSWSSLT